MGDARRGDDADDVNDDDFLVEPRAFEVRRRYAYADESDIARSGARPDAPPRSVARPPPYAATVRLGLRRDGTTVALRSRTADKALEPSVSTFAVEGFETRVDAYVGTPKKRGLARLFGVGVGGAKTAAARRAQKGLKCRESYVVSRNAVSYRRLGEAPAWAGPGRLCAAELSARRVSRRALRRGSPVARGRWPRSCSRTRAADGSSGASSPRATSEDVDEPPPKKSAPPPKRGDKWERFFRRGNLIFLTRLPGIVCRMELGESSIYLGLFYLPRRCRPVASGYELLAHGDVAIPNWVKLAGSPRWRPRARLHWVTCVRSTLENLFAHCVATRRFAMRTRLRVVEEPANAWSSFSSSAMRSASDLKSPCGSPRSRREDRSMARR